MAYIGMLFDTISNTSTSYDLFRKPKFNSALKDLLDHWGRYLMDPNDNSNSSLTDHHDGWFNEPLLSMLEGNGRGTFNETYICPDPCAIGRGFATFDAFFTRRLQPHARPVHFPENKAMIHSACESYVYRITHRVKKHDQFWLKGQYYSLYNMLDRDEEHANQFVGGTVYQAYLSTVDYHRWHAPVDGVITKTVMVPGTYYAVLPDHGAGPDDPELEEGDPAGAIFRSQAWLTAVSTRALVYIRADNPDIGLMCFMAIGMREVSTCEITVRVGQRVKIGDDLGTFHIGGSSHTMIFQPQAKVTFADHVKINEHIKVKSIIGQVERAA
jgi:phosphatidylserine decarboxylase